MALRGNCPTLEKIGDKEEMFVLRAQDRSSPHVILKWIELNLETCPDDKLDEAFECAMRMKHAANRKAAD